MTGLYPAGHGIHENGRTLPASFPVLAERLHEAGYRTEAFVSAFVLARQFGLARGFDVYDDTMPAGESERSARATTDAAVASLRKATSSPRFVWVHYYDPHYPYAPPEPWRTEYAKAPYLGEIASMDHELGRLVQAFEASAHRPAAIVLVADHGEGLGDHGEERHGTLLYQSTMHVPLVIEGPGVKPGRSDASVSTRRVFSTILDWAGAGSDPSLRANPVRDETVAGEAMKPFLEYGWQPQVMAVDGRYKAIEAGKLEAYDLAADPAEAHNLGSGTNLPGAMRKALDDYPLPSPDSARPPDSLDAEAKQRLAALGYVGASVAPVVRKDAPRPADMTDLLPLIDRASGLFAAGEYADAIPLLEQIRAKDPGNLDATLRLATCDSELGRDAQAEALYQRAAEIAPVIAGRADLSRAALRAHEGLDARGAAAGESRRRRQRSPRRARGAGVDPRAAAAARRRRGAARQGVPAAAADRCGAGAPRRGWRWRRGARRPRSTRSSGRGRPRARASRTTSSWACSTWTRAGSPTRGTRSTAFRRRAPSIRWRSSNARRWPCCCTSPTLTRASRPRGRTPIARPRPLIARERLFQQKGPGD